MQFSASTSQKPINPHPARAAQRLAPYRWFFTLALTVFILDQATKLWIFHRFPLGTWRYNGGINVISGFFSIVHVGNQGAAWSLFSGQNALLALLAFLTLCAIFYWRRSLALKAIPSQISFGLLCGGITGNLVDRIIHHHVIDFLDFHFGDNGYTYPTFNVADSGICVGVIIYLIYALRNPSV